MKSDGAGELRLDGQEFSVPAGGISLDDVYFDQVAWTGGPATITIEGTTFNIIQAALRAPAPVGENVKA